SHQALDIFKNRVGFPFACDGLFGIRRTHHQDDLAALIKVIRIDLRNVFSRKGFVHFGKLPSYDADAVSQHLLDVSNCLSNAVWGLIKDESGIDLGESGQSRAPRSPGYRQESNEGEDLSGQTRSRERGNES